MDTLVDYEALRHIAFACYEDMKSLHPNSHTQKKELQKRNAPYFVKLRRFLIWGVLSIEICLGWAKGL